MLRSWFIPAARRSRKSSTLRLETLEDRSVPAALSLSGSQLVLTTSNGDNVLGVSYDGNNYTIRDLNETIDLVGVAGTGSGTNQVQFSPGAAQSIHLNMGDGNNVVYLSSLGHPLTYQGGAGNDTLLVGDSADTLDMINAPVTFLGGGGNADSLEVNDYAGPAVNHVYTVTDHSISRGAALVTYDTNTEFVRLTMSTGNEQVNVLSTSASVAETTISGKAGGVDTVIVGNQAHSLDDIHGIIVVQGKLAANGLPDDSLVLDDSGNTHSSNYILSTFGGPAATGAGFSRDGQYLVTAGGMLNYELHAGPRDDVINVWDTAPQTHYFILTGGGDDVVTVGDPYRGMDDIFGDVLVLGSASFSDTLAVNDAAAAAGHAYTLSGNQITRTGAANIVYQGFNTLRIDCTGFDDQLTVQNTPGKATVDLNMEGGNDTLQSTGLTNDFYLTGPNQGTMTGPNSPILFTNVENIQGGAGNDAVHFSPLGRLSGKIDGGGGVNQLDYSSMTLDVSVNLKIGTATNVGMGLPGSVSNFRIVLGSNGNNLLVGDDKGDTLIGGAADDVIIGGLGSDLLQGGGGDDLLIAGGTIYDNSPSALNAIFLEWAKSGQSYHERIGYLRLGTAFGSNGLNGNIVLTKMTVIDDGVVDVLFGGLGQDWFWANRKQDVFTLQPGEMLN